MNSRERSCKKVLLPNKKSKRSEIKIIKHFEPNAQFSNRDSSDNELPYFHVGADDENVSSAPPQSKYKERRLTNISCSNNQIRNGLKIGSAKWERSKPTDSKRIKHVTISCRYKAKNLIKEAKATQTSTPTLEVHKTQSDIAYDSYLEDLKREIACNESCMRKTVSDLKNEIWLFQSKQNFEQFIQRKSSENVVYDEYFFECEPKIEQLVGIENGMADVDQSTLVLLQEVPNSHKIKSAQELDLTRTKGLALTKEDYFTVLNDQNTQIEKRLHLVTKAESLVKHIIPNDSPHSPKVIEVFNMSTQIDLVDSQEDSPSNKPSTSKKSKTKEKKSKPSEECDQAYATEDILSVPSGELWPEEGEDHKFEFAESPEVIINPETLTKENLETQLDDYANIDLSSISDENIINTPINLSNTDKVHTKLSAHLMPSVVIRRELVTQKIPDVVIQPEESTVQIDKHQNVAYEIVSTTGDKTENGVDKTYCDIDTKKESSKNILQIVNTCKDEVGKKIMEEILKDPDALSTYKSYQVIEENRVLSTCDEEIHKDLSFIDKDVYQTYVNPSGFKNIKCTTGLSLQSNETPSSLGCFYQNKATQVDGILHENVNPVGTKQQKVLLPKQSLFKVSKNSKNGCDEKKSKDTISEATVDVILSINSNAVRDMSQQLITVTNSHLSNSESSQIEAPQCDSKDALNKSTISDEFLLAAKMEGCSSKTESFQRRSSTGSNSTVNTEESLKIFSLLETPSNSVIEASHCCGCPKFCFPKLKKEKTHLVKHESHSRPRKSSISDPKNKRFNEIDDGNCPSDYQQRRKVKIEEPLFGSHRLPLQECDPNMESFIKELTIGSMSTRASIPATVELNNPARLHTDYSNEHVLSVIKRASEGLDDTKTKHTVMPVSVQQPAFIIDNCNCEQIKQYLKYTVIKYTDIKKPNDNVEDLAAVSHNTKSLGLLEDETRSEGEVTGSCDPSIGEIRSCLEHERVFVKELEKTRRKILNRKVHNSNWVTYYVSSDESTNNVISS